MIVKPEVAYVSVFKSNPETILFKVITTSPVQTDDYVTIKELVKKVSDIDEMKEKVSKYLTFKKYIVLTVLDGT